MTLLELRLLLRAASLGALLMLLAGCSPSGSGDDSTSAASAAGQPAALLAVTPVVVATIDDEATAREAFRGIGRIVDGAVPVTSRVYFPLDGRGTYWREFATTLRPSSDFPAPVEVIGSQAYGEFENDGRWMVWFVDNRCCNEQFVRHNVLAFDFSTMESAPGTGLRPWVVPNEGTFITDTFSMSLSEGWLAWHGLLGTESHLLVTELADAFEANRIDIPIPPGSAVEGGDVQLTPSLLAWGEKVDGVGGKGIMVLLRPFDGSVPFEVGRSADGQWIVDAAGDFVAWREGEVLRLYDARLPIEAGVNPRAVGHQTNPIFNQFQRMLSAHRLTWLEGDAWMAIDLRDSDALPVRIDSPDTLDGRPTVQDDVAVWLECRDPIDAYEYGRICRNGIAGHALQYLDLDAPLVSDENPRTLQEDGARLDPHARGIGPLGVAWAEHAPGSDTSRSRHRPRIVNSVHYYNPSAPIVPGINPGRIREGVIIDDIAMTPDGLVMLLADDEDSIGARVELIPAAELLLATQVAPDSGS